MDPYEFVRVTPAYRGVVRANVDDIWRIVKQWAPSLWIRECKGVPVEFHVLTGETGEQVGATRATVVGDGVVMEQLVAVDAEEHYLTWKCISDERSINPFPGSFMNYVNTLRFTPLTNSKETAVFWEGELWTDVDMAETMDELLSSFYQDALESLEKQIKEGKQNGRHRLEAPPAHSHKDPATIRTLQREFGSSFR